MIAEEVKHIPISEAIESHRQGFYRPGKFDDGSTLFLRISDITDDFYLNRETVPKISIEDEVKEKFDVRKGDFLFARTGGAGRFCLIKEDVDGIFASYLIRFRFNSSFGPEFLRYFFMSNEFQDALTSKIHGGVNQNVHAEDIKGCLIPVFSIPEQERIVAKLDAAFAAIDQAKANVEQNLHNAKELFQSKLNEVFSQRGDGWVEKKLVDTCKVERGSSPRPIKQYITDDPNGVNWVKIGDTKNVEKYIESTDQKITPEGALKSRRVEVGDFILSNSMSYGKPYIMKTTGYIHDGWFVLRLNEGIDTEFYWYLLSSPYLLNQFEMLAAGAIVKNISGDLVKKAILPIPPVEVQNRLVKEFDELSAMSNQLQTHYTQKLAELEELKKSLLERAFKGEI